jgi:CRP-like cAMP-binding protein
VLEQTRLSATARALEPTRAVRLNGKQVLAQCEHNPRFGFEFMRRAALALANRLNATRLQLLNVYGDAMPTTVDD